MTTHRTGAWMGRKRAVRRPLMIAFAIAAAITACRSGQDGVTAFRERQATVLPLRARLSDTLGTAVEAELDGEGALVVRWHVQGESVTVDQISHELRTILATLRTDKLAFNRVVIEGVVDPHSHRWREGAPVVRARFGRGTVYATDWNAGAGDPLTAADEITLQAKS